MTAKSTDPTPPEGFPPSTAARDDSRYRYLIIDRMTGEVVAQTSVWSHDALIGSRVERGSGGMLGVPFDVAGRRLTLVERRRAYLDAIRSMKREGGRKLLGVRSEISPVLGGQHRTVLPTLIADVLAKGHLRPKAVAKKHRPSRVAVQPAQRSPADESASEPIAPLASAGRSAVNDFKAEADRLSLPLGTASSDEVALQRLKVVAADAKDIFPDTDAAVEFLTTRPLDERGRNGIEILRQKGLPGIISSLDQRRFGYSG